MPLEHEPELMPITDGNVGELHSLIWESTRDGYLFLQRTIDDWYSGANKFDKPGEKLWGLFTGKDLVGVGGLNIDPYSLTPKVGRVRHLYVRKDQRRAGCATIIMNKIMEEARQNFTVLRLFTDDPAASVFYEKLGFERTREYKVSHCMALPGDWITSAASRLR
ncbi:GNAT family N-acetyltransferase [Dinghuibacter silviterrae]|uniref:Acetyltransferase (GNAT) family protein n=1 Tax=Dinghuibacter silviterrae TaxID=1539049 RepID=A0A4R8DUR4_9BACT|nr:GNAT family N-acetyltransferase [Dinghuibacter silviterrae]TDX00911.1 acetyltransferase (GNAT) family protein [Dinghuibacter silviterrae]